MPVNQAEEFARVTQYEATTAILGAKPTRLNVLNLAEKTREFTLQLVHAITGKSSTLACEQGCSFCCYLMATVSAPEALLIVQKINESFSKEDLTSIRLKVDRAFHATEKLNNHARIKASVACPFLTEEGSCQIYDFRPLDCITYHSKSRTACEKIMQQPDLGHPVDASIRAVGIGIKSGLGSGILDSGLETPALRYELIEAVHICLHDEKTMDKYLVGENILVPAAIISDHENGLTYKIKHAPPHLKERAGLIIAEERGFIRG